MSAKDRQYHGGVDFRGEAFAGCREQGGKRAAHVNDVSKLDGSSVKAQPDVEPQLERQTGGYCNTTFLGLESGLPYCGDC